VQGLIEILKRYKVNYIIETGIVRDTEEFAEWQNLLKRQKNLGAKIINVKFGDLAKLGNVNLEILAPFENLSGQNMDKSSNEVCVVAKLIYGKNSFLFTGDIGFDTENKIKNLESDVLKVSHHGSKYSTSELFLQNVKPEFAVIEVGKNSYGHPTPEVLQRLEKFGIKTLRTDENKNIVFSSDGENIYYAK
jgi:competence protein ComEC